MNPKNFKQRAKYYSRFGPQISHQRHFWAKMNVIDAQPVSLREAGRWDRGTPALSFGAGVSGTLQIQFKGDSRVPVVWVAASRAEKKALRYLLVKPQIEVVPYALPKALEKITKRWNPNWVARRKQFFRKMNLREDLPLFYYAGRMNSQKGLGPFLDLIHKTKVPCQLLLAGFWEGDSNSLKRKLLTSKVCRVLDLGIQNKKNNYAVMSYADAVVSLSTDGTEEFGYLPREALSLGIPILVTNWGGFKDIRLKTKDAQFIKRFPVVEAADTQLAPNFGRFNFKKWAKSLKNISNEDRKCCSREMYKQIQDASRRGLTRLSEAKGRPVRFTRLSYQLTLLAVSQGVYRPDVDYPRALQLAFMGGN